MKVVPRTNGEDPTAGLSTFALGGGKAVVPIETSGALDGKAPPGVEPKIFVLPGSLPRVPNPGLLAKPANPPDAGAAVPPPNNLPGPGAEPANPV